MFVCAHTKPSLVNCQALAWGHSNPSADDRFHVVSQFHFIKNWMSEAGRLDLLGPVDCNSDQAIGQMADKWIRQTGIRERVFFDGSTADLAAVAAKDCLEKAGVSPDDLDMIIGGTNTGPGYPSLADHVKLDLGIEASEAMCMDMTEACPIGAAAIFAAWTMIHASACQRVLVVCSEKATTLTTVDNWRGSNLFGDAAFAVLLQAGDIESFVFFEGNAMPFGGNLGRIVKSDEHGFFQDGTAVHKFVGKTVASRLVAAVEQAGLSPAEIGHLVPHQPSGKTLELLESKISRAWPEFDGVFHRNVSYTGNTSGASTGHIISTQIEEGVVKRDELVLVATFGSGLTTFNYAFRV